MTDTLSTVIHGQEYAKEHPEGAMSRTYRPTSPALEKLIGEPTKVLDHGLLVVCDYMGTEQSIVNAARVSYQKGNKQQKDDVALIRYLMRYHHMSPFEMCEISFAVKMPIFVARQWIRHRTACLEGSNLLHFVRPDNGKLRAISIEKYYKMWHKQILQNSRGKVKDTKIGVIEADTRYTIPELSECVGRRQETLPNMVRAGQLEATRIEQSDPRQPSIFVKGSDYIAWANTTPKMVVPMNKERLKAMQLRMLDEESREVDSTSVVDIWKSGKKKVYRITTDTGHVLNGLSANHLCLTDKGWLQLKEFVSLKQGTSSAKICVIMPKGKNPFIENSHPIDVELTLEKWRWIPGLEKHYKVSNYGRVRSYKHNKKVIKTPTITPASYYVVSLQYPDGTQKTKLVHRLVASAWLPKNTKNNTDIRHLNGNRMDCRDSNLAWGTSQQNSDDMIEHENSSNLREHFAKIVEVEYLGKKMTYDLEVAGPYHNFVVNGFVVHNSVNELSGRYSILEKEFYLPSPDVLAMQSSKNMQGRDQIVPPEHAEKVLNILRQDASHNYGNYEQLLNATAEGGVIDPDGIGIARELARMNLTLNYYTSMMWKCDLRNWMHFLGLRADAHAQWEIRQYADIMLGILKDWQPNTYQAFLDYQHNAYTLSAQELALLKGILHKIPNLSMLMVNDVEANSPNAKMSKREKDQFIATFMASASQ
jgi:flavin-dependent thymidylate synthase